MTGRRYSQEGNVVLRDIECVAASFDSEEGHIEACRAKGARRRVPMKYRISVLSEFCFSDTNYHPFQKPQMQFRYINRGLMGKQRRYVHSGEKCVSNKIERHCEHTPIRDV